uniref:Uncharacterized protein n=1 Tax=Octopus bimaculoides TaxID=37653 RepID=A0A0L8HBB0_OCTBM
MNIVTSHLLGHETALVFNSSTKEKKTDCVKFKIYFIMPFFIVPISFVLILQFFLFFFHPPSLPPTFIPTNTLSPLLISPQFYSNIDVSRKKW